ncbi:2384_t:CDS:1, partial [Rhizophagus irregularis]
SGRKYGRDLDNDYDEMEIEDVPIPPKREYDMKMDIDGERKRGFSNKEDRDKYFIKECPNPGIKRGNKNIRVRVNVPPEKYVMDMYNEKANITYGQIYNENPKFRRIARNYDEDDNA